MNMTVHDIGVGLVLVGLWMLVLAIAAWAFMVLTGKDDI